LAWRRRAGVSPSDVSTPSDLLRLPTTAKVDYRRNFSRGVLTASVEPNDPLVLRSQSSGTGGDRLVTLSYTYDLTHRMRETVRAHPPFANVLRGLRPQRICRYAAPNCSDVECASPHTTMSDRILVDGTLVLPVGHDLFATPAVMVDQAIAEIEEYGPHWFYTDATHLAFLVRQMRERRLPLPPVSAILLTYTLATHVSVRQIREAFPEIPISEVVSMTEFGWIAMQCPEGQTHLNTTAFYTELVCDGRIASTGELGELVVTSLGDRLLPHIRYRTGDMYRLLGPCACGCELPAVRHEGRSRHMIMRGGEIVLTPKELDDLFGAAPWALVYKLHQLAEDHIRFSYIPSGAPRSGSDDFREKLQDAVGGSVRVDVEEVPHIATDRTGKFLACTSAVADASAGT